MYIQLAITDFTANRMNWNKALKNDFTKLNTFKNVDFYPTSQVILLLRINLKKYKIWGKISHLCPNQMIFCFSNIVKI